MEIELLSSRIWNKWVEEAAETLPNALQNRMMRSLLTTAHNRHIGLTPQLAVGLAKLMIPTQAAYESPWDEVMKRLTSIITEFSGMNDMPLAQRAFSATMMPSVSIRFGVYELAFPLVLAAARQIGRTVLFVDEADAPKTLTEKAYQEYAENLKAAIISLAKEAKHGRNLPITFWKARALTLMSLTRERNNQDSNPHPSMPLPDASLLLNLKPETSYDQDDLRKRLQLSPRRVLTDPRQHEAGASSVKIARGIEDLHRMAKSEMIYPDLIFTDRLLNTGYWSIQPPPKPIQLRQLLLVAICPTEISQSPMGVFIKANWLHFLTRFCHVLQQNDLVKSEMRWIEGDLFAQARSLAFILRDMPAITTHFPDPTEPRYLYQFLSACGWFPSYMDRHVGFKPVTGWQTPFSEFQLSMMMDWMVAAWNSQQEFTRWTTPTKRRLVLPTGTKAAGASKGETFTQTKLQADQYTHVHLIVFLPSSMSPNTNDGDEFDEDLLISPLQWRPRFKGVKSLTVLYMPEQFAQPGWEIAGDPTPERSLLRTVHELDTLKLSGILIDEWFEHIAKGMGRA